MDKLFLNEIHTACGRLEQKQSELIRREGFYY